MNMRHCKLACVLALSVALTGLIVSSAMADPIGAKNSTPVTITCGRTTYRAVVNGNGAWTPAHDLNSNSILIPVAFGVETDIFTPAGGSPEISFTTPRAKGSAAPKGAPLINCTYQVGPFTFPDGSTFQANGSVTGFVTPATG